MDKYREVRYPSSRLGTVDLGRIGLRKHHVAGLLEIDVTEAMTLLRSQSAGEGPASFFAWLTGEISRCIADNRHVQALSGGRRRLILFEDVDATVLVEKKVEGHRVPLPLVIRRANSKTAGEIHQEIRAAQRQSVQDEGDFVLSRGGGNGRGTPSSRMMRLFYRMPGWCRVLITRLLLRDPFRTKAMMGTVVITSIGSVGRLPGWVIPRSMHNLCFALGSVIRKPRVVEDRIEIREILHMTVLFDHDVVDGAPAARFMTELVERLERPHTQPPPVSV